MYVLKLIVNSYAIEFFKMHQFSTVKFFFIISTAVSSIQALPRMLHYPEEQYWQWQSLPRYFVEYPCSTNKASDRLSSVQNQDPALSILPPNDSMNSDKSIQTERDASAREIPVAPVTPTQAIDEQAIENILTNFFAFLDSFITSKNVNKSVTNKRSVEVKTNNEKLKEEDEKQSRPLKYEFIPRWLANDEHSYFSSNYLSTNEPTSRINAAQNRSNFITVPIANYPFANSLPDMTDYVYSTPMFPASAYSIFQANLVDPYNNRIVVDPLWNEQQVFPIIPSTPYPQPVGYYVIKVVEPEATNNRKPSESNIKDRKPSETKSLSSAESEPLMTPNEAPSTDNEIPQSTSLDEIRNIPLVEVATVSTKNLTEPELKIGANEMTRLSIVGDRKKANSSTKSVDAKTKPNFPVSPKKKLPTPTKPSVPKSIEFNQLMEKIREIRAQIRASILNKDRRNQSKLHS